MNNLFPAVERMEPFPVRRTVDTIQHLVVRKRTLLSVGEFAIFRTTDERTVSLLKVAQHTVVALYNNLILHPELTERDIEELYRRLTNDDDSEEALKRICKRYKGTYIHGGSLPKTYMAELNTLYRRLSLDTRRLKPRQIVTQPTSVEPLTDEYRLAKRRKIRLNTKQ